MEFIFLNKLIVFLISAIAIWLGGLVYFNNPRGKINRIFVVMVVLMLSWVNFAFFARLIGPDTSDLSSLFLKIAWFVTPPFFVLLYFLIIYLLNKEREYQFLSKVVLLVGGITTLVVGFTDLIIKGIKFVDEDLTIIYGVGMLPSLGIIFFLILATLYPLMKGYLKSPLKERGKIEYFLVGILIFYLSNVVFNIIFPIFLGITRFYYIGDYSAIFLLGFTGYAILKRQLFGIKTIFATFIISLILILISLDIFLIATESSFQILKIGILILLLYFSYLLSKSVKEEIDKREELEKLTKGMEIYIRGLIKEKGLLKNDIKEKIKALHRKVEELERLIGL